MTAAAFIALLKLLPWCFASGACFGGGHVDSAAAFIAVITLSLDLALAFALAEVT